MIVKECHYVPVVQGVYKWGNVTVEIHEDGSAAIKQGDQVITVEAMSFFCDVSKVFNWAISEMKDGFLKQTLFYKSTSSLRSMRYFKRGK